MGPPFPAGDAGQISPTRAGLGGAARPGGILHWDDASPAAPNPRGKRTELLHQPPGLQGCHLRLSSPVSSRAPCRAGEHRQGTFASRNRPAVGQTLMPAGDSRARAPPDRRRQGGEHPALVSPSSRAPQHRCHASLSHTHPPPTLGSPPLAPKRVPPPPRERAEALTLAGATFALPTGPAPRPGGGGDRRWRRRRGGLARWVRVPRVGTGGETTPPCRPLPERKGSMGLAGAADAGEEEEAGGEEGPGPLHLPAQPFPTSVLRAGWGRSWDQLGISAGSPRQPAFRLVSASTWEELAGSPRTVSTPQKKKPQTRVRGDAPAPRKNPKQEGGWCKSLRGRRSRSRGGRPAPPHPRDAATPPYFWGAAAPPPLLMLALMLL